MPILGVGLDVVDVAGFAEQLSDAASGFLAATFRPGERQGRPGPAGEAPAAPTRASGGVGTGIDGWQRAVHHLAGRFAAKEAFVKAWSSARRGRPPALDPADLDLRDIEVVDDGFGRPALRLHGAVRRAVAKLAADGDGDGEALPAVHLSISHDGGVAAAVVVLEA